MSSISAPSKPMLVSIVTPVYNGAKYIEETVRSVLEQSYPHIEYLVINDGSTDNTMEVLSSLKGNFHVIDCANGGQAAALNFGWSRSSGDFLAYLSADDLLSPRAIETTLSALVRHPNAVCAFPDSDLIDGKGRILRRNVCRPFELVETIVTQECYIGPGAIFRRDVFLRLGGWRRDLRLAPDREYWMRIARHGDFVFVQESLAQYRIHSGAISFQSVSESISLEYVRIVNEVFENEGITQSFHGRKTEALARANLVVARNCLRGGKYARAWHYAQLAVSPCDGLTHSYVFFYLLRTALSKRFRWIIYHVRNTFHV